MKLFAAIPIIPIDGEKSDFDLCKLSEEGRVPLAVNVKDDYSICMRIPLSLFLLKRSSSEYKFSDSSG